MQRGASKMGQTYRIDRLHIITYRCKPKKIVKEARCRYLAKSQIVNGNAKGKCFDYLNFRGSHFKKVDFSHATISGCDFWGASFNKCNFHNAHITDSVFMGCRFTNCVFDDANVEYTTVVNTNLAGCRNIVLGKNTEVLSKYPNVDVTSELEEVLNALRNNVNIRKYKLLHLPGNKFNYLNIYLLQKKFSLEELSKLLWRIYSKSNKNVTTYKKLELALKAEKRML